MTTNTKPAQCRFDELADGEMFHLLMTHLYGSSRLMQRVIEHEQYNAIWVDCPARGELIPGDTQVVRVNDVFKPDTTEDGFKRVVSDSGSYVPTVVAESTKHTLVLLNTDDYAFKDVALTGSEWIDIQDSYSSWNCISISAEGICMCINDKDQYCFIFWDEADQCSQPYPTVQEAMDARKRYMENL